MNDDDLDDLDLDPEPFEDTALPSFDDLMGTAHCGSDSKFETKARTTRWPGQEGADSLDAYEYVKSEIGNVPEPYRSQINRKLDQLLANGSESARRALRLLEMVPWRPVARRSYDEGKLTAALDDVLVGAEGLKARLVERARLADFVRSRVAGFPRIVKPLLFAGPPGNGKTTVARAFAKGLGRTFATVNCHGICDGFTLIGSSDVYTEAGPGAIAKAFVGLDNADPVILLEEVATMTATLNGDPFPPLLALFDGENDGWFEDRLLGLLPVGQVSWCLACNDISRLPAALLDRVEIVDVPAPSPEQCLRIARLALVPRLLTDHGLDDFEFAITDAALKIIVLEYGEGLGVRQLENTFRWILAGVIPEIAAGHYVVVDSARARELLSDSPPSTPRRHRPGL